MRLEALAKPVAHGLVFVVVDITADCPLFLPYHPSTIFH
jgi:hypothetical protein